MITDLKNVRVIFVSSIIPPEHSGAGKRIYEYYKYLNKKGTDVSLITRTINCEEDSKIISIKSIRTVGLFKKASIIIDFVYTLIQFLLKWNKFDDKKYDINIVWLTSANTLTFVSSIFFYLKGFKIITQNTLLGSDDFEFRYPGDFFGLKYRLKKLQYSLSVAITSISPALHEMTKNYHSNSVLIPNPVDLKKFRNNIDIEERRKKKVVLTVGSVSFRKGTDIVLKTYKEIQKIDPDVEFILVGPTQNLDVLLEHLNIDHEELKKTKIKFEGFCSNPVNYYLESSLFFLPSRREGFGTVFIEAMAAGLPVVGKELKGITEDIFGKNNSTILKTESPACYAEVIIDILNSKEKYRNESLNNLNKVKKYNKYGIYNKYNELLNSLTNK